MSMLVSVALLLAAPGQTGATPAPPPSKPGDGSEKMVCKRFAETGSLVRAVKVCKTKADWQRERDDMRAGMTPSNGCAVLDGRGGC